MSDIILKPWDLLIKTINTKNGEEKVVQIKGSVAFNEGFINNCIENGVTEYVDVDEEE